MGQPPARQWRSLIYPRRHRPDGALRPAPLMGLPAGGRSIAGSTPEEGEPVTNEANRLRGLLVMLGVFVPLTVVGTAATPGNRLFTAVAMTVAFTILILLVMALWSYRPAWLVRWAGPLKDLDPEDRRLVTRAVRSGEAVADPRLAQVAASVAGRTARAMWLVLVPSGLNAAVRVWSLAEAHSTAARVLEALSVVFWLGYPVYGITLLLRARRSEAANLAVLAQV